MSELKEIAGNRYLFTWVDGIYIRPDIPTMERMEAYIGSIQHNCSTEWLRDFKVKVNPKFVNVDFLKIRKGVWEHKPFNLPHANSEFKRLIVDAILSRKIKANK